MSFSTQHLGLVRESDPNVHFRSEIEPGKDREALIFFVIMGFEPSNTLMRSRAQTIKLLVSYEGNKLSTDYTPSEDELMCRRSIFVPCGID